MPNLPTIIRGNHPFVRIVKRSVSQHSACKCRGGGVVSHTM